MAITGTRTNAGKYSALILITSTADADTGDYAIAHGLVDEDGAGVIPALVILTPTHGAALLSEWSLKTVGATNVSVTKNSIQAGSGEATPQLSITAINPHSLTR